MDEILSPSPVSLEGRIQVGVVMTPQMNFESVIEMYCIKFSALGYVEFDAITVVFIGKSLKSNFLIVCDSQSGFSFSFECREQYKAEVKPAFIRESSAESQISGSYQVIICPRV